MDLLTLILLFFFFFFLHNIALCYIYNHSIQFNVKEKSTLQYLNTVKLLNMACSMLSNRFIVTHHQFILLMFMHFLDLSYYHGPYTVSVPCRKEMHSTCLWGLKHKHDVLWWVSLNVNRNFVNKKTPQGTLRHLLPSGLVHTLYCLYLTTHP